MTLDSLIDALTRLRSAHGNLPVLVEDGFEQSGFGVHTGDRGDDTAPVAVFLDVTATDGDVGE